MKIEKISERIENMQLGITYSKDFFKRNVGQRNYDEGNVKNLMESISKIGQIQPIVIDKNGNTIDGGNRLEAITRINESGEPTPYVYVQNFLATQQSMLHANTKKKDWNLYNLLNYEAENGDAVCQRVLELHKEYKEFPLGTVATIMNKHNTRTAIASIKREEYEINEKRGKKVLDLCRRIGEEGIISATEKSPHTLPRFVKTVKSTIVLNDTTFDPDHLILKASLNPDSVIRLSGLQKDMMRSIGRIYNSRKNGPIKRILVK